VKFQISDFGFQIVVSDLNSELNFENLNSEI